MIFRLSTLSLAGASPNSIVLPPGTIEYISLQTNILGGGVSGDRFYHWVSFSSVPGVGGAPLVTDGILAYLDASFDFLRTAQMTFNVNLKLSVLTTIYHGMVGTGAGSWIGAMNLKLT